MRKLSTFKIQSSVIWYFSAHILQKSPFQTKCSSYSGFDIFLIPSYTIKLVGFEVTNNGISLKFKCLSDRFIVCLLCSIYSALKKHVHVPVRNLEPFWNLSLVTFLFCFNNNLGLWCRWKIYERFEKVFHHKFSTGNKKLDKYFFIHLLLSRYPLFLCTLVIVSLYHIFFFHLKFFCKFPIFISLIYLDGKTSVVKIPMTSGSTQPISNHQAHNPQGLKQTSILAHTQTIPPHIMQQLYAGKLLLCISYIYLIVNSILVLKNLVIILASLIMNWKKSYIF